MDTNRVAWAGYSLGAQRELAFFLRHPERQPKLLVRRAGGWIPELQQLIADSPGVDGPAFVGLPPPSDYGETSRRGELANRQPSTTGKPSTVLLIHGEHDEVFTLAEAERVAACLRTNGVPVELRVLPGEGHGGPNGLVVCRMLGEQCLARLNGPDAFRGYRSILSWQSRAWPLWLFWTPAILWAAACVWFCRNRAYPVGTRGKEPQRRDERGGAKPQPEQLDELHGLHELHAGLSPRPSRLCGLTGLPLAAWRWLKVRREIGLRWLAAILAAFALAQTAVHLVPPRLPVGERTLAFARKHLVTPSQRSDFDFLAAQPCWRGQPLKTLLEHVELANYNRELVNWKVEDSVYREFVLSPVIEGPVPGGVPVATGGETPPLLAAGTAAPLWRRVLWESFYPRVRREQDLAAAAEIVVRHLRERVTVVGEDRGRRTEDGRQRTEDSGICETWQRQISDERGFEVLYMAAMRCVGVPSRLGSQGRAEFWTGSAWQPAPRPLVERWK